MKAPRQYRSAFAEAGSADEVFVRLGLREAAAEVRGTHPDYAAFAEELVNGCLPTNRTGQPRITLEAEVKRLNRILTQPQLPFATEQIPSRPIEELIEAIEQFWPVLWVDEMTGEIVTIRTAVAAPELFPRVIELLHANAAAKRRAADDDAFCLRCATEIVERLAVRREAAE